MLASKILCVWWRRKEDSSSEKGLYWHPEVCLPCNHGWGKGLVRTELGSGPPTIPWVRKVCMVQNHGSGKPLWYRTEENTWASISLWDTCLAYTGWKNQCDKIYKRTLWWLHTWVYDLQNVRSFHMYLPGSANALVCEILHEWQELYTGSTQRPSSSIQMTWYRYKQLSNMVI